VHRGRIEAAGELYQNTLLVELFAEYKRQLFERWVEAKLADDTREIRARAQAADDLRSFIDNKCGEILGGK
jgi:hypothetical protein